MQAATLTHSILFTLTISKRPTVPQAVISTFCGLAARAFVSRAILSIGPTARAWLNHEEAKISQLTGFMQAMQGA